MSSNHGKETRPGIEPLTNGPLRVTNMSRIVAEDGTQLPAQKELRLCRCGHSAHKPYCDNSHVRVGFRSAKEEGRLPDRVKTYNGDLITIHDNRGVCSHAEYCVRESPAVFKFDGRPWILPDADDPNKTARTIEKCPSGALSYTRDGVLHKNLDRSPAMYVVKDGPYNVVGSPELKDPDGNTPESPEHYALCRCGRSRNKPFCDGTHDKPEPASNVPG